jgi:hypothetical protein
MKSEQNHRRSAAARLLRRDLMLGRHESEQNHRRSAAARALRRDLMLGRITQPMNCPHPTGLNA